VWATSEPEKRYHSFGHATTYTSACGINIYRGGTMFSDDKMHAFTCEPFHNLIQHHILEEEGVSFKASTDVELQKKVVVTAPRDEPTTTQTDNSTDSPSAKAVTRSDDGYYDFFASEDRWCRPVMARDGPDGALYIADMYRLMIEHPQWLPKEGQDELLPHYRKGDDKGRIYRVSRTNQTPLQPAKPGLFSIPGWLRDRAQMLFLWGDSKSHEMALPELAKSDVSAVVRAQATWTLHLLGKLKPADLAKLFTDPHPRVREQAILIAENYPELQSQLQSLAEDRDAKVRLQLALSSKVPSPELIYSPDAYTSWVVSSKLGPRLNELSEKYDGLPLLDMALRVENLQVAKRVAKKMLPNEYGHLIFLNTLIIHNRSLDDFGLEAPSGPAKPFFMTLSPSTRSKGLEQLRSLLNSETDLRGLSMVCFYIARFGEAKAPTLLMANFTQRTPSEREVILDAMTSTQPLTLALFKLAEPTAFDSNRRAQLTSHPDKAIRQAAEKFFGPTSISARKDVLEKFKAALTLPGDAAKGKQVFLTAGCIACHQLDGVGIPLGPDLRPVVQHTNEKLFNSILDPSAIIEPGFTAYHCTLNNGEQLYGIISTETSSSLTLKMAGNLTRSVLRTDIKQLQSTKTSLMPDGLEALLTPQSLADLMAYLRKAK
jgi:putative heme-binding domain-containing protein